MRFETNEIIIETVDGGAGLVILIYPNPLLRNVKVVWQGAPADCKQTGRGLRIDFTQNPQPKSTPTNDDISESVTSLFLAAQKAYLAGDLKTIKEAGI